MGITRVINKWLLLDQNLNLKFECLPRNWNSVGANYINNRLTSFNIRSSLDRKKFPWKTSYLEAIISYEFNEQIEGILTNIFFDKLIDKKLLGPLSESQLAIAKNLIFAKHNYKFDSEYYQAFFNLFTWYNSVEKRQTRTKEVNHLLTDADKENLKIINKELKKYEK